MKSILNTIRAIGGAIGFILIYGGVGTIDFHSEVGNSEPTYAWVIIGIGLAMLLPWLIHALRRGGESE